jgi:hypothetical protein
MDEQRETMKQAAEDYTTTKEALDQARDRMRTAIVDALEAGMTPTEVNQLSPFTPAYNRRIAAESGLEPRPRGPKKKP